MTGSAPSSSRPWLLATALGLAAFWIVDLAILGCGTPALMDDTWEYAVAARHLLAGDGFVTSVLHPPLWTLRDASLHVPILIHGPLLPILVAPGIALFGPGAVDHVAWLSALFAWLAAVTVYRIGARHFAPPAGLAAAMLLTLSPVTLTAVHHDVAITLGALLLAVTLDLLTQPRSRPLLVGFALGLGYLARPEFLFAAPILAIGCRPRVLRFAAGFIAVAAPWWWHQFDATGSPVFNLSSYLLIGYWGRYPDLTVLRDFAIPPAQWMDALRASGSMLVDKWLDFLPHALLRVLLAPTPGTGALAWLGLAIAWRKRATRPAAAFATATGLIPLAIMTTTVYDARYVGPFMPLWALAAAFGAHALSDRVGGWVARPRVWLTLALILALPTAAATVRRAVVGARALQVTLSTERAAIHDHAFAPIGLLFSDTPDFLAWTLDRPVVWLTRGEHARLPACDEPRAAEGDRPCRSGRVGVENVWFHE